MSTSEAPPQRRRLHLGDSLILIAALALALTMLRSTNWFARFYSCQLLVGRSPEICGRISAVSCLGTVSARRPFPNRL